MKKLRLFLFYIALCGLLGNSCTKVPGHLTGTTATGSASGTGGTSGGGNTSAGSLSLKADGVTETASISVATIYISAGGGLQIISQLPGTHVFGIMLTTCAVGTFDVITNNAILTYGTTSTYADTYLALTVGTVTITSYTSTTVAGTFSFTGTNPANATKVITNGVFSLPYIKI